MVQISYLCGILQGMKNKFWAVALNYKGGGAKRRLASPWFCTEKAADFWAIMLHQLSEGKLFKNLGFQRHNLAHIEVITFIGDKEEYENEVLAWQPVTDDLDWYGWLNNVAFADEALDHCPCCAEPLPEHPLIDGADDISPEDKSARGRAQYVGELPTGSTNTKTA